jgi:hypothetical protein
LVFYFFVFLEKLAFVKVKYSELAESADEVDFVRAVDKIFVHFGSVSRIKLNDELVVVNRSQDLHEFIEAAVELVFRPT